MREWNVELRSVERANRSKFLPYLLLADESERVVKEYISEGQMFEIIVDDDKVAGVALFMEESGDVVELKNIALDQKFRGHGLGKKVIASACDRYRVEGFRKMIVGTANSSIANIAFYQKAGFRMAEIRKDFFLKYPEPIFEDGIRAVDMVMFERVLEERE